RPCATPKASGHAHKSSLRAPYTLQHPFSDREVTTDQDFAFHGPPTEGLFVPVSFIVAIIEPTHRGIAPVHDPNPGSLIEKCTSTNEHLSLSLPLFEHEPGKIGGGWIDEAL